MNIVLHRVSGGHVTRVTGRRGLTVAILREAVHQRLEMLLSTLDLFDAIVVDAAELAGRRTIGAGGTQTVGARTFGGRVWALAPGRGRARF